MRRARRTPQHSVKESHCARVDIGWRLLVGTQREAAMHANSGPGERAAMGSRNRLKLGLFGANCSSGRAVTMVPERWSGSWPDCLRLAQMADEAGIEFMLPI